MSKIFLLLSFIVLFVLSSMSIIFAGDSIRLGELNPDGSYTYPYMSKDPTLNVGSRYTVDRHPDEIIPAEPQIPFVREKK